MARKTGSHSEITGPKIKQTALKLFARYGFAAVSMRKIASEVGVQAGAIYNYTPDKQGLLFDLLYGHMEDLLTSWHLQNVSQDPIAALDHFVGFHLDFHICIMSIEKGWIYKNEQNIIIIFSKRICV